MLRCVAADDWDDRLAMQHENVVVLDLESELIQLGMARVRNYENAGAPRSLKR